MGSRMSSVRIRVAFFGQAGVKKPSLGGLLLLGVYSLIINPLNILA